MISVRSAKHCVQWVRLVAACILILPGLLLLRVLTLLYNVLGYRVSRHLDGLARLLGLRTGVPLLPLFLLSSRIWPQTATGGFTSVVWLGLALAFIEIHASGLYQASSATSDSHLARPLVWRSAWRVKRSGDLRLHRLLEVHVIYAVPLIAGVALTPMNQVIPSVAAVVFVSRYYGHSIAWADFEAVIHWNMHTRSLVVVERPFISRFIRFWIDYVVGPINGYVPRLYEAEHLRLHHRFDSGPGDIYSPLPYRRSSILQFCWFASMVVVSNMFGVALFPRGRLSESKRRRVFVRIVVFWSFVIGLIVAGSLLGWLLVGLAYAHGLLQARNQYEWHGLVNPDAPLVAMGNTVLWISSLEMWDAVRDPDLDLAEVPLGDPPQDWTYFDNFHLLHHLHPSAHFKDYLRLLRDRSAEIERLRSTVMLLSGLKSITIEMWIGDVDGIAKNLITDSDNGAALISSRLQPVESMRHRLLPFFESPGVLAVESRLTSLIRLMHSWSK